MKQFLEEPCSDARTRMCPLSWSSRISFGRIHCSSARSDLCSAVVVYIAPVPAVTFAAPSPVIEDGVPAQAVELKRSDSSLLWGNIFSFSCDNVWCSCCDCVCAASESSATASAVSLVVYAAPAPVVEYRYLVKWAPPGETLAPAAVVTSHSVFFKILGIRLLRERPGLRLRWSFHPPGFSSTWY